jgi:OOP family OmpA-OmpF porin
MFDKKLSLVGASGVLALVASTCSLANIVDTLASVQSVNNDPGLYVGLQAGVAKADYGNSVKDRVDEVRNHDSTEGGAALRVLTGWNFNQYFAAEAGYNFLPTNDYSTSTPVSGNQVTDFKEKTYAVDLVGKASLPLNEHFDIYAKAGGAYVKAKANETPSGYEATTSSIEPTYGLGVAYHVNQNVGLDASWTQIYGKDSYTDSDPTTLNTPLINFLGLGVNYKFN